MSGSMHDPVLQGLSISDFSEIVNAVWRHGEDDKPSYVFTVGGSSRAFAHDPMGIQLRFEAKRDFAERGYKSRLYLSGESGWIISCFSSIWPPGNTENATGYWSGVISEEVRLDHLGSCGMHGYERFLFGFKLEGDVDAYRKDMSILRLAVDGWRDEE
jgi:hypothetical protein